MTTLKLEVDKTYVNGYGNKILIVHTSRNNTYCCMGLHDITQQCLFFDLQGRSSVYCYDEKSNIVKEYRKPRIIQKDVVHWYNGLYKQEEFKISEVGYKLDIRHPDSREISRRTVTFTVED